MTSDESATVAVHTSAIWESAEVAEDLGATVDRAATFLPVKGPETRDRPPFVSLLNAKERLGWYEHLHRGGDQIPAQGLFFLSDAHVQGHCLTFQDDAFLLDGSEQNAVGLEFARSVAHQPQSKPTIVDVPTPLLSVAGPAIRSGVTGSSTSCRASRLRRSC